MDADLTGRCGAAFFPIWCTMGDRVGFPARDLFACVFAGLFPCDPGSRRSVHSRGPAGSTTLKFIHCDFIESGKESVLMTEERGCGLARYGDGLQRSLRSLCSQMMNNGSPELIR